MPRYIDAEKIDFGKALYGGFARDIRDAANSLISEAPTADVAPVIHAHWIKVPSANYKNIHYYDCSKCKHTIGRERSEDLFRAIEWNGGHDLFCPYCGAKMDGVEP